MAEAGREVVNEQLGELSVPPANEPVADQLAVRADAGPGPDISGEGWRALGDRSVLLLRVAEGPNLIALDALAVQPLDVLVMESKAGFPSLNSLDTVLMETSATRDIDRMEEPSTSMERIWMRLFRGSLFMP